MERMKEQRPFSYVLLSQEKKSYLMKDIALERDICMDN